MRFSRSSLGHPSKGASSNTPQPLYSNLTSHCTHGHYLTRVRKKRKKKKELQLLPVAALLVGAMRHRHKISRQSARGNRPDRKKSRTGRRGAREHAASTSQHQCGEIFGGLQNSNSFGVLLLLRRTGDDTLRGYVLLVSSSSSSVLLALYSNTV